MIYLAFLCNETFSNLPTPPIIIIHIYFLCRNSESPTIAASLNFPSLTQTSTLKRQIIKGLNMLTVFEFQLMLIQVL